jgi:hypothetical protein
MEKILSYNEAMALARKHYCEGGDSFYECTDRRDFERMGPVTEKRLLESFGLWKDYYNDMINTGR